MSTARVLFVLSGVNVGGAERQLLYLLDSLDRSRFAPEVLTVLSSHSAQTRGGPDITESLKRLGVPHHRLDASRFPSARALVRLRRKLRDEPWDLVQTYGIRIDLPTRLALRDRPQTRLFASIRGLEQQRPGWLFRVDGQTSGRVHTFIANTAAGKAAFSQRTGIDPQRIAVVPNGIDADAFTAGSEADATSLREEWDIPDGRVVGAVVANLHAAKGHEDLWLALEQLSARATPPILLLMGSDRSAGRLEAEAKARGIHSHLRFLGVRKDVATCLAACDFGCLSSHHEGMPNALMEAMAMGLPVVATRVGGIPELVTHDRTGLLVPARDPEALARALGRITTDAELRAELGAAGYQRIREEFSLQALTTRTSELFAMALRGSESR